MAVWIVQGVVLLVTIAMTLAQWWCAMQVRGYAKMLERWEARDEKRRDIEKGHLVTGKDLEKDVKI